MIRDTFAIPTHPDRASSESYDVDILRIEGLAVDYPGDRRGHPQRVVDEVDFALRPAQTLGLVGESGSGKTTIARAVLGLVPIAAGTISLRDVRLDRLSRARRRKYARDIQVVLQDPYSSLNPAHTVAEILAEPLREHRVDDIPKRVADLLDMVGLPNSARGRYPSEFSGGQRQRIAIARAISLRPTIVVCDEPVSALDLTTQARILDLFLELQRESGIAYLFISHDLDVIRHVSHDVAVLDRGRIVETGPAEAVTSNPEHPYSRRLLDASPVLDVDVQAARRAERRRMTTAAAGR